MNITIGQYYPVNSLIHKLDPRVKILSTFVFITALFLSMNVYIYLFSAVCLAFTIIISKVPFRIILRSLKSIFVILIITSILNVFFTTTGEVLFQYYFIKITIDGIVFAFKMMFRLIILIIGTSLLTLTTNPIQITSGIEYLLTPFKKIGIPAHEIAMMMTIALRFIPTLQEELDKIKKAQISRGADFETGNLVKKAKALIPLLIPLFVSSFRRADELAMAMEARCYRGDIKRSKMKILKLQKIDYIFIVLVIVYFITVLIIK